MRVMRTPIAIDERLMGDLMQAEPGVSRSEAVRRAVSDYLGRKRIDEFMTLAGSRLVDLDWRAVERQELDHVKQARRATRHRRSGRQR